MSQSDIFSANKSSPPLLPLGPQQRMFSPPNPNAHLSSAQSDLCSGEPEQKVSGNKKQGAKSKQSSTVFCPCKTKWLQPFRQSTKCLFLNTHTPTTSGVVQQRTCIFWSLWCQLNFCDCTWCVGGSSWSSRPCIEFWNHPPVFLKVCVFVHQVPGSATRSTCKTLGLYMLCRVLALKLSELLLVPLWLVTVASVYSLYFFF